MVRLQILQLNTERVDHALELIRFEFGATGGRARIVGREELLKG